MMKTLNEKKICGKGEDGGWQVFLPDMTFCCYMDI
jgi:hypothetical protein